MSVVKPFCAVLALVLVAAASHAQPVPAGSGLLAFKEKLKIGGGCDSFRGEGALLLTVDSSGSWVAETPVGIFSGTLVPADERGRKWNLAFDAPSLDLYGLYLESGATALCGTPVTISSGAIDRFQLKFSKGNTQASLQLRTTAEGSTDFGSGRGKHLVKGKGTFAPSP